MQVNAGGSVDIYIVLDTKSHSCAAKSIMPLFGLGFRSIFNIKQRVHKKLEYF